MKRTLLVLLVLVMAIPATAGTLSWTAPTKYVDGSTIPSAKVGQITYQTFYGDAVTGPWTAAGTTNPGVLSATVPDPAVGNTRWYTVDATLDGQTSAKAAAVSKTVPFPATEPPAGLTIQ